MNAKNFLRKNVSDGDSTITREFFKAVNVFLTIMSKQVYMYLIILIVFRLLCFLSLVLCQRW